MKTGTRRRGSRFRPAGPERRIQRTRTAADGLGSLWRRSPPGRRRAGDQERGSRGAEECGGVRRPGRSAARAGEPGVSCCRPAGERRGARRVFPGGARAALGRDSPQRVVRPRRGGGFLPAGARGPRRAGRFPASGGAQWQPVVSGLPRSSCAGTSWVVCLLWGRCELCVLLLPGPLTSAPASVSWSDWCPLPFAFCYFGQGKQRLGSSQNHTAPSSGHASLCGIGIRVRRH